MRDIKFRAWDKKFKKMVGLKGVQDFFSIRSDGLPSNDNYELMQYTGLKDKNGKEIYEGDIVFDGFVNKTVVMYEGRWQLERKYSIDDEDGYREGINYQPLFLWAKNIPAISIIGNIYENAELLELK